MSELTNQISELRARAVVLRQGDWSDGEEDAAQLEQAADTIESLRDRLQADGETCEFVDCGVCKFYHADIQLCEYGIPPCSKFERKAVKR